MVSSPMDTCSIGRRTASFGKQDTIYSQDSSVDRRSPLKRCSSIQGPK